MRTFSPPLSLVSWCYCCCHLRRFSFSFFFFPPRALEPARTARAACQGPITIYPLVRNTHTFAPLPFAQPCVSKRAGGSLHVVRCSQTLSTHASIFLFPLTQCAQYTNHVMGPSRWARCFFFFLIEACPPACFKALPWPPHSLRSPVREREREREREEKLAIHPGLCELRRTPSPVVAPIPSSSLAALFPKRPIWQTRMLRDNGRRKKKERIDWPRGNFTQLKHRKLKRGQEISCLLARGEQNGRGVDKRESEF